MKKYILIPFFCVLGLMLMAQVRKTKAHSVKHTMYMKPRFQGGDSMLYHYIATCLHYPDAARENNISGKVIAQFIVDEQGYIVSPKIKGGIGGGCDEQVISLLNRMPCWVPATYNGKPTRAFCELPVVFGLKAWPSK